MPGKKVFRSDKTRPKVTSAEANITNERLLSSNSSLKKTLMISQIDMNSSIFKDKKYV